MADTTAAAAGPQAAGLLARPWYRWYVLGVLVAVFASSHVDRQIMGMLLEPIKAELGASDTQMGFLIGLAFATFYATLGMPIAMLADRSNRRNIIAAAAAIWSGMTAVCGLAATFTQLALARIGVAVGEAGSSPPSHSLISDLFPTRERATAMGVYALGVNFGLLIAYLGGGFLNEAVGWRMTFVIVGVPGLLLALLVRLTVVEPPRGHADGHTATAAAPPFLVVARHMWTTRAARHVMIGSALAGFVGYGMVLWLPAFFARSHGLDSSDTGLVLAFMTGVVGALGTFAAGRMGDLLSRRDMAWLAWVVAVGKLLLVPFLLLFFWMTELKPALFAYLVPAFFGGFYLAPTFTMIQALVPVRMRAVAAAITLFVLNIIGMGIGPQAVGIMSDLLADEFGKESLRWSLALFSLANIWCAVHYWLAGRTLGADIAAVRN